MNLVAVMNGIVVTRETGVLENDVNSSGSYTPSVIHLYKPDPGNAPLAVSADVQTLLYSHHELLHDFRRTCLDPGRRARKSSLLSVLTLPTACTVRESVREFSSRGFQEARIPGRNRRRILVAGPELFATSGVPGRVSVTAAIGLCGCLHFLRRTEMMTALVFGFLLSL